MKIELSAHDRAELEQGLAIEIENGEYVLLSREYFDQLLAAFDVPELDESLFEVEDLPDET